jgi:hypothetical protein
MRAIFYGLLSLMAVAGTAQMAVAQSDEVAGPAVSAKLAASVQRQFQPYTAEFKTTQVQTLANGTTITRESSEVHAVDSQHRTMNANTSHGFGGGTTWTTVNVHDPVAGTQGNWNSQTKKATIYKLPSPEQRHGCWQAESGHYTSTWGGGPAPGSGVVGGVFGVAGASGGAVAGVAGSVTTSSVAPVPHPAKQPKPEMEDLGTTTIQGVEAHGHRSTWTIPVGQIGNDQPLVRSQENWFAPSLGLVVREVNDDPQTGTRTKELVSLSLSEPDPSTFLPPEGYEAVTEVMVPCKPAAAPAQ